jgi:CHAD domain-containing protein
MRVNGSHTNGVSSQGVAQRQAEIVFDRMNKSVQRLAGKAKATDVHRFRTNSRRVEALVGALTAENSNKKKLLKVLAKSRKKAGKVRDLDVQIDFLKELKIPDRYNHRAQLMDALSEEQARRTRKLTKYFNKERVGELRKRLRRAESALALEGVDPLKLAFNCLPKVGLAVPTEKTLHACRIAAKRARYLAELLPDSATAKTFVTELKRAQDEIGRWHDVLKLTQRAEQMFGGVRDSALVSALQNVTHARFRRAANALQLALKVIDQLQKSATPVTAAKTIPLSVDTAQRAAA